jgi:hypothetical protein
VGHPELGQKKLKELKKSGHPDDAAMDEETRAWYDGHRQAILCPPSTASSSPSTTSTPVADETSPPEAQEGTADEPIVV